MYRTYIYLKRTKVCFCLKFALNVFVGLILFKFKRAMII